MKYTNYSALYKSVFEVGSLDVAGVTRDVQEAYDGIDGIPEGIQNSESAAAKAHLNKFLTEQGTSSTELSQCAEDALLCAVVSLAQCVHSANAQQDCAYVANTITSLSTHIKSINDKKADTPHSSCKFAASCRVALSEVANLCLYIAGKACSKAYRDKLEIFAICIAALAGTVSDSQSPTQQGAIIDTLAKHVEAAKEVMSKVLATTSSTLADSDLVAFARDRAIATLQKSGCSRSKISYSTRKYYLLQVVCNVAGLQELLGKGLKHKSEFKSCIGKILGGFETLVETTEEKSENNIVEVGRQFEKLKALIEQEKTRSAKVTTQTIQFMHLASRAVDVWDYLEKEQTSSASNGRDRGVSKPEAKHQVRPKQSSQPAGQEYDSCGTPVEHTQERGCPGILWSTVQTGEVNAEGVRVSSRNSGGASKGGTSTGTSTPGTGLDKTSVTPSPLTNSGSRCCRVATNAKIDSRAAEHASKPIRIDSRSSGMGTLKRKWGAIVKSGSQNAASIPAAEHASKPIRIDSRSSGMGR